MRSKLFRTIASMLLVLTLVSPLSAFAASPSFSDVSEKDWFYNVVTYAAEKGYLYGVGDDRFDPNAVMTRAMFVVALRNVSGVNGLDTSATGTNSFADVPSGTWYTEAVQWASGNNLVEGYSENQFAPDDKITREQAAVIIEKYAALMNIELQWSSGVAYYSYSDGSLINYWASSAINKLSSVHLMNGYGDGNFGPQDALSRSQATSILVSLVDPDRDADVLYEENGVRITSRGLNTTTSDAYADLGLYLTYSGDQDIMIQTRDEKVNGESSSFIFSPDLQTGSKVFSGLWFDQSALDKVESIKFYFIVVDANTMQTLYSSDTISLTY